MGARSRIDYERIEAGWRAGLLSPRNLAAIYTEQTGEKVSHAAIIKHFTTQGIPRDLSAKIKAKSDAMVTAAMVTEKVTTETKNRDRDIVDRAADTLTNVRLAHRSDIHRARKITNALLRELEQQTDPETLTLLQELGDLMRQENDRGTDRRNDLYQQVISLTERSKTMKTLSESLRTLVDLERTAFGMDKDKEPAVDALGRVLQAIATSNNSAFLPIADDPERVESAKQLRAQIDSGEQD